MWGTKNWTEHRRPAGKARNSGDGKGLAPGDIMIAVRSVSGGSSMLDLFVYFDAKNCFGFFLFTLVSGG